MKKKFLKVFKKISFTNFFFFVLSIISTTFAWFAYSNIVNNDLSVNVKAWNISITDDSAPISNLFTIAIDDIYPGSSMQSGDVLVTNNGDLSAIVGYKVKSLRLFNTTIDVDTNDVINDLALDYPFTFNFSISSDVIDPGETSTFNYSIDWPMDSGNNMADSEWGNTAASFIESEESQHTLDSSYEIRSGISLVVELTVTQNADNLVNSKNFGDSKYFDITTLNECETGNGTCLLYNKMHTDDNGTYYLGDLSNNYESVVGTNLNSYTNIVTLDDILNVVKNDIYNTKFVIDNYSDRLIGNVDNVSLLNNKINTMISNNGYIKFSKNQYYFLQSNNCYWLNTSYDSTHYFAIKNVDANTVKIYKESITNSCMAIPIIYIESNDSD